FFQAEDGIRDDLVTGVQTCALPIYWMAGGRAAGMRRRNRAARGKGGARAAALLGTASGRLPTRWRLLSPPRRRTGSAPSGGRLRSEERRVGEEGGARRWRERESMVG